jgi:hypothetical protein
LRGRKRGRVGEKEELGERIETIREGRIERKGARGKERSGLCEVVREDSTQETH